MGALTLEERRRHPRRSRTSDRFGLLAEETRNDTSGGLSRPAGQTITRGMRTVSGSTGRKTTPLPRRLLTSASLTTRGVNPARLQSATIPSKSSGAPARWKRTNGSSARWFALPPDLKQLYATFGNTLDKLHDFRLPMSARYVVDQDRRIGAADVNPDDTIRPEPEDTAAVVRQLQAARSKVARHEGAASMRTATP